MIVSFDSFKRVETPQLVLCNPGCIFTSSDGALSSMVGVIPNVSDLEMITNFNAMSEINFRMYKLADAIANGEGSTRVINGNLIIEYGGDIEDTNLILDENYVTVDDTDVSFTNYDYLTVEEYVAMIYRSIQSRRLIYIENFGFFMVTNITDGFDGNIHYKDVSASSIEIEIQNRMVSYIKDGTYNFLSILEDLVSEIPLWMLGYVDDSLKGLYRTFQDVSVELNMLGFMIENVQDAYECIFDFDCIHRKINVYAQDNYVKRTSIHLTKDNFINSIEIQENADNIYTALSVFGADELSVNGVNPLGNSTIYNFDYYIDWMSPALRSRVRDWKNDVEQSYDQYNQLADSYYTAYEEQLTAQQELDRLKTIYDLYANCIRNMRAEKDQEQVPSYNTAISENGGVPITIMPEIEQTVSEVTLLAEDVANQMLLQEGILSDATASKDSAQGGMNGIRSRLDINSYFMDGNDSYMLDELNNYIFEGSYSDEYITVTESMNQIQRLEQMRALYKRGVSQLEKISQPVQEFTVDVDNFAFIEDMSNITSQLHTGCLVNVEIDEFDVAELFLSSITINYEDADMSLTFGNRFNKSDPKSVFEDVLGNIQKSSNTLSYVKDILYPVKEGAINELRDDIKTSRTITKNSVISSQNETVVIDDTGYTGRRVLANGEYDPHQIMITGRTIAFTDDSWDTSKTAVGLIYLPDGSGGFIEVYGINAEAVIGELIIGNGLQIMSTDEVGNKTAIMDIINGQIELQSQTSSRIDTIENTQDGFNIRVQALEDSDGQATSIKTEKNYTFDDDGLYIRDKSHEIQNRLDNTGMYVDRVTGDDGSEISENVLTANNEGVFAMNLSAKKYLIIGNNTSSGTQWARFEPYTDPDGRERIACFFTGSSAS